MTRASDTARLVSGGAVFNEASNDVDFRVEGNGNANMLVVDAGNDRVGIGTGTPSVPFVVSNGTEEHQVSFASGEVYLMARNQSAYITQEYIANQHVFTGYGDSSSNEAMRMDSSGNVLIGTTSTSAATDPGVILKPDGLFHMNNSTTSSGISLILLYSSHSTTDQTKFEVTSEGNVKSRTNSYAGFSDERLKEQIVDASSQWDDIKAIEIKNFKFISNLDDADNPKMLGVIAQQVEKVSPNLVEIDPKDDMKTVKYSLLYLKAVKALQEAMARIETLEAEVAKLKG